MNRLPTLNTLYRLKISDAFQILELRKIELNQVLYESVSAYHKKRVKAAIKRVENHLKALA